MIRDSYIFATLLILLAISSGNAQQVDVQLPSGFEIEQVADDRIATNIFCMTVNSQGETVVSGPGYVRTLLDNDGDGKYETARTFCDFPRSGAQGMYFDGHDLLVVGDGGLWLVKDTNGDGVADEKPERLVEIKTGGEHDAHAIRKGPMGWWWLLCGNGVPAKPEYYSGPNSPVKDPSAGFLMRMSPDFTTKEIYACGFRNAYDFDFNRDGEVFVFDSDGERDISLPWYRPTRLFQIRPGDHAGFITTSWKRPSYYFDMPKQIGDLGRGSPTGVTTYMHHHFGAEFDDAIFVADWTFGRVSVFQRDPKTLEYDEGSDFAIAQNDFGFAVTDLCVNPAGNLLVSVGGRGTQGGVYRIKKMNSKVAQSKIPIQPFDSWGRSRWMSPDGFSWEAQFERIVDESVNIHERLLLVQRLHESSGHCSNELAKRFGEKLVKIKLCSPSERVAVQLIRSSRGEGGDKATYVAHEKLARTRKTLTAQIEEMVGREQPAKLVTALVEHSPIKYTELVSTVYRVLKNQAPNEMVELAGKQDDIRALAGIVSATNDSEIREQLFSNMKYSESRFAAWEPIEFLNFVRFNQLLLGGAGNAKKSDGIFDGYTPLKSLTFDKSNEQEITNVLLLWYSRNLDSPDVILELSRLAAMLKLRNSVWKKLFANKISFNSDPVDDIHWLICLAQLQGDMPKEVAAKVGNAIVAIDKKLIEQSANRDRNWNPKMQQLAKRLFRHKEIAETVVEDSRFGSDGHLFLFNVLPRELKSVAAKRMANKIAETGNATPALLRAIATDPGNVDLIRGLAKQDHLRDTAIEILAKKPKLQDRPLFASGLESVNSSVARQSANALRRLGDISPLELVSAFGAANRLGWDRKDNNTRRALWQLTSVALNERFGFDPNSNEPQPNVMLRWKRFLQEKFPTEFSQLLSVKSQTSVVKHLSAIDAVSGDIARGKAAYTKFQCANCHDGGNRLGPRLEGVTKRFSREDLYQSIVDPSQQVSDRYRALLVQTVDGAVYRGTMIYDSVDGITLLEANGQTVRINRDNIDSKANSRKSLMPDGLMEKATNQEWADLLSYLGTIN